METYIGIDIAKYTFDLNCLPEQKVRQFENNTKGIRKAVKAISKLRPKLIVMEATGGYEALLAAELHAAKLPVAVVNPRRIRDFARANRQLAKTDKLDATEIALFAARMQPPTQEQIGHNSRLMRALVARRHQLIRMRTAENNRREHVLDRAIGQSRSEEHTSELQSRL